MQGGSFAHTPPASEDNGTVALEPGPPERLQQGHPADSASTLPRLRLDTGERIRSGMKSKQGQGQNLPVPEFYKLELWPQSKGSNHFSIFFQSFHEYQFMQKPKWTKSGHPWCLSGKESACPGGRYWPGFDPWSGKIPQAAKQLSQYTTTIEPVL